jgi:Ca2+/Na+ antiporter
MLVTSIQHRLLLESSMFPLLLFCLLSSVLLFVDHTISDCCGYYYLCCQCLLLRGGCAHAAREFDNDVDNSSMC